MAVKIWLVKTFGNRKNNGHPLAGNRYVFRRRGNGTAHVLRRGVGGKLIDPPHICGVQSVCGPVICDADQDHSTAATLGVLTLGISLTTVIFAVADPFLLKPLSYSNPAQLVLIESEIRRDQFDQLFQGPRIADWQAHTDLFESVAAFATFLGAGIVVAGIVPAWIAWRTTFSSMIHRSLASEARKLKWLRFTMAAGQSATAMVLLVGGALLVRSYWNLWSQDTRFPGDAGLVSVSYPPHEPATRLAGEIGATVERLRRIPGITKAGATSSPFLDNIMMTGGVRTTKIAGRVVPLSAVEVTHDRSIACRVGRWERAGSRCSRPIT
jgi:hypothetical protein